MADKMMRQAVRGPDGMPKAVAGDEQGNTMVRQVGNVKLFEKFNEQELAHSSSRQTIIGFNDFDVKDCSKLQIALRLTANNEGRTSLEYGKIVRIQWIRGTTETFGTRVFRHDISLIRSEVVDNEWAFPELTVYGDKFKVDILNQSGEAMTTYSIVVRGIM